MEYRVAYSQIPWPDVIAVVFFKLVHTFFVAPYKWCANAKYHRRRRIMFNIIGWLLITAFIVMALEAINHIIEGKSMFMPIIRALLEKF